MQESYATVDGYQVKLTNLNKLIWPEGLTKAHLVKYYREIAPYILPHLYNRPLVMKRYPHGLGDEPFYQKECPSYAPDWIIRHPVEHSEKVVNYIICNNMATLVWLANQGAIEMHPWLSRIENVECPDIAVIDLDPAAGSTFRDVLTIALLVKEALAQFNLQSYPKTSGATGLHIFVPIKPVYSYKTVTKAMQYVAELIVKINPGMATVERKVAQRQGKVYLDYLQNGRGKTMAFQYSLRPLPGAPVSTPLYWDEIGALNIEPGAFSIHNIFSRIKEIGDIYHGVLTNKQTLDALLKLI
ncbi:putative ATP-dependent DNA ligase YkoU [Pelotomaculum schinkii]|uniref:Putative ATP-dependent DNA ligase YkoU n=1 Tax=Pelotomaculum schinkii TaxID=78350 RepID=A0A4Y7RDB3_9FIRM|nr:non-homologous end-joining DNA ligase [Pelotomaculum schinkii]TEB06720.1 putative ATP-dependent DNA ligase YkoU [Pelotomaculum schinkii]